MLLFHSLGFFGLLIDMLIAGENGGWITKKRSAWYFAACAASQLPFIFWAITLLTTCE